MIISNIGTIVLSLYPNPVAGIRSLSSSAETVTTTQVRLISISNTLSRLVSGPLADIVSPLISHIPDDGPSPPRKYRISRVVLLSGTSLLLAGAFVYCKDVASVAYDPHSLGSHKRHTVVAVIR